MSPTVWWSPWSPLAMIYQLSVLHHALVLAADSWKSGLQMCFTHCLLLVLLIDFKLSAGHVSTCFARGGCPCGQQRSVNKATTRKSVSERYTFWVLGSYTVVHGSECFRRQLTQGRVLYVVSSFFVLLGLVLGKIKKKVHSKRKTEIMTDRQTWRGKEHERNTELHNERKNARTADK